jgi:hypothetical protein
VSIKSFSIFSAVSSKNPPFLSQSYPGTVGVTVRAMARREGEKWGEKVENKRAGRRKHMPVEIRKL